MKRLLSLVFLTALFFLMSVFTVGAEPLPNGTVGEVIKHGHQNVKKRYFKHDLMIGKDKKAEDEESAIDKDRPMIALTFDDGPSKVTLKILEILKNNNSKATFFMVGNRIGTYESVAQAVFDQGSELASHSWDHANLTKLSKADVEKQFDSSFAAIKKITGENPTLLRPPYGSYNDVVKSVAKSYDVAVVNWSVDPQDWKVRNSDAIYENIIKNATNGSIILCHDLYSETVDAIKRVVPELIKQGYQLVTVSELIENSKDGFVAGKVYRMQ